ncbi:MAG: BACON domain-containing protein [Bacteroidales bacterium]|nr:BACON domain-containing protein [Bacteroidales bacterium]MCI2122447.1 BACON domain-containing protein [Bacteroidales bacterium]MCI2145103.1 BACON domain-containing protein [Bacteroidales bacterium]
MKRLFPFLAILASVGFLFFASSSCEKGVYPYFTLSKDTLNFGYEEDSAKISVKSNVEWWIYTYPSTVTMTPLEGDGDGEVTIICAKNSTANERDTVLAITTETIRHTITIIQAPNPDAAGEGNE